MKKRLISMVLLAAMTVSLAACGKDKATEKDEGKGIATKIEKPVEISFWHAMNGANEAALKKLTEDFEKNNENIKVNLVYQGSYRDLFDKLMGAAKSNTLPNMTQIYSNRLSWYVEKGLVEDLNPYMTNKEVGLTDESIKDVPEMFLKDGAWDGKQYAFPLNKSQMVLYYNEDMLKAKNVEVPKTWDELKEAAKKLTVDNNNDGTPEVYGLALENNISTDIGIWVKQAGGEVINEKADKINFDTPETKAAVDFISSMIGDKTARLAGEDKNANTTFNQEKAAMAICSTSAIPYIQKGMKAKWFAAPLPTYKEEVQLYYGTNVAVFNGGSDEEKLASWLYIKYLTDTENTAYFSENTGYIPVRKSAFESESYKKFLSTNPVKKVPLETLDKGWQGARNIGVIPALDTLGSELEQVFKGQKSVDDALKSAQEKGEAAMKEARSN
ncbi:MAG: ABC transporter substrate-binding protein [Clostridium sp.]|uniref:ABC transporter substrate-binding protein n=1 Tax=Clostridium sp. TaxID=1506 RepID=UPI002A865E39|nr:ABC transporter substrate-binding protein [Clostridium sp.]MDY5097916.1 ABC transporter substrate-binding protein [Clostridium sp.]